MHQSVDLVRKKPSSSISMSKTFGSTKVLLYDLHKSLYVEKSLLYHLRKSNALLGYWKLNPFLGEVPATQYIQHHWPLNLLPMHLKSNHIETSISISAKKKKKKKTLMEQPCAFWECMTCHRFIKLLADITCVTLKHKEFDIMMSLEATDGYYRVVNGTHRKD